jgi:hypothetical protein
MDINQRSRGKEALTHITRQHYLAIAAIEREQKLSLDHNAIAIDMAR